MYKCNPPSYEFHVAHSDRICKVCILNLLALSTEYEVKALRVRSKFSKQSICSSTATSIIQFGVVLPTSRMCYKHRYMFAAHLDQAKRCFVVVLEVDNLLLLLTSSINTFRCQYIHSSQLKNTFFFTKFDLKSEMQGTDCHGLGICLSHFLVYFDSSPSLCRALLFTSCLCLFSCQVLAPRVSPSFATRVLHVILVYSDAFICLPFHCLFGLL